VIRQCFDQYVGFADPRSGCTVVVIPATRRTELKAGEEARMLRSVADAKI